MLGLFGGGEESQYGGYEQGMIEEGSWGMTTEKKRAEERARRKKSKKDPTDNEKIAEYHQIRNDVRHINTIYLQAFVLGTAIFGILATAMYQISKSQNTDLLKVVFAFGVLDLIITIIALCFICVARTKAIEIAHEHADIFDFINKVKGWQKYAFISGIIAIIISLVLWIIYSKVLGLF